MPTDSLSSIQRAVESMHGCPCQHESTGYVHEQRDGKTVWKGIVETFALTGHSQASRAYAWSWADEKGGLCYISLLNLPPITTPREAVQAAIARRSAALTGSVALSAEH